MSEIRDYRSNGDIALHNKQYEEALKWYSLVLQQLPNDVYCLTKCGAIYSGLGKHEESLGFFERAYHAAPGNGNNVYNYANACLIGKDFVNGLRLLTEAESKGVSEEVLPKLYLQLAMICCMRNDAKSAHVYFDKCEKADKSGLLLLSPEVIAEKMRLYTAIADYVNAEKMAGQLVAINPAVFSFYLMQYGMAMLNKKTEAAERILDNAEKFAVETIQDKLTLLLQRCSLYLSMIEEKPSRRDELYEKTESMLKNSLSVFKDQSHKSLILVNLAEIYNRIEKYDASISVVADIIGEKLYDLISIPNNRPNEIKPETAVGVSEEVPVGMTDEEVFEMEQILKAELEEISAQISDGLINTDPIGYYDELYTDEYGDTKVISVPYYDSSEFALPEQPEPEEPEIDESEKSSNEAAAEIARSFTDRVYFALLTALLGKEDFENARRCALLLRNAQNKAHSYFAKYIEALAMKKLYGMTDETKQKYLLTIAYFRSRAVADSSDVLASVFRARMYAEQGDYDRAVELSRVLNETDRKNLLEYLQKCQKEQVECNSTGE